MKNEEYALHTVLIKKTACTSTSKLDIYFKEQVQVIYVG